jgi:uncharacterized repeat protein (TIGR03803 family)
VLLGLITAVASIPAAAMGSEKTVYAFSGGTDGSGSLGGLTPDGKGNFYGTSATGGGAGFGNVYRLSPTGREKVLYQFQGGSDGAYPGGGITLDSAGNLYGATFGGGSNSCSRGCGTIFRITPLGKESVLYIFQGGADGVEPVGNLALDSKGNLYGATLFGGDYSATECADTGCGTVFEIQADGSKITLHTFLGGTDGALPAAGVIIDADDNLYGTTTDGGNTICRTGCGTVFKISPGGAETVLHAFCADQTCDEGSTPESSLLLDGAGNLYGTAAGGGGAGNNGTVFKLAPDGTETVLYSFKGGSDGFFPEAGVIMDEAGNLFGTTFAGGIHHACHKVLGDGCGTVFEVKPNGSETVLYAFTKERGTFPVAPVLMDKNGSLYGTTSAGGKYNQGVVFKVRPK